ncbi:GntR family transcriptional regulator [Amycolatopsis sp. lyj-23]|uniref:GntR family transcriptional regulator n=1 Tax=Amycolatopsis sp. lyj-23 TaxID=2789283 RepID=UPI00397A27CF
MASPSTGVRPIESRSVAEQVTVELRRSILCGDLEPGREFSLREIAGMLNVSFIPVRDALRNLESEGLVITRPGRSALVAPLDLDDLHAIYRLRRTIEPEIASRACLLLADGELDRLEQLAAGFGDEQLGMDAIYDAHHEFHMALLAPAASAWDVRLLSTLWRAAERYIRIGFGALDPDPQEHHRREEAHEALIDVFRRRDPDAAARAVRDHLERNERIALRALGDGEPADAPAPQRDRTAKDGRRPRR